MRKELAEKEGVPAYALFTNEQLAEMVQRRVGSLTAMKEIEGVGDFKDREIRRPIPRFAEGPRSFVTKWFGKRP